MCESLTSKISVSDIGYFDVNMEFEKYRPHLDEIEKFRNELLSDVFTSRFRGNYEFQLIQACETVLKIFDALISGDYQNSELLFNYIDCLNYYISTFYKSKEMEIADCIKKATSEKDDTIDYAKIDRHIETFNSLMRKVIRAHMVFEFDFKSLANFEKI